ncbi:MAG: prepilin-type N-terminal cleavage/methylation domain-containing protein [Actinomycetota bacterium]|nr:prepilin-type N-terminal cleavage/methylation domain-containing protein [Actinomycetota bacterium]
MSATRPDPPGGVAGDAGFTLVELLVAVFLFGVVMVALTGTFIAAVRSVGDQRLRTSATRVATDRLETLRSMPFDQLDAQAGQTTTTTPDGRAFTVDTTVTAIDAATGAPAVGGAVKQIAVTVSWTSRGTTRNVSYTTAVARDESGTVATAQAIGTVTMFPSPATADASGRPLQDIDVTVPLTGFDPTTLVNVSWTNADGTAGAKTLTSATGLNWRGTIAKEQVLAAIGADGRGEVRFDVSAGTLAAVYTLSVNVAAASPPSITTATIDRNPVTVSAPAGGRTCADRNQCENTTDVVFTVTVGGLDPTQDSVILQYQLHDGSFQEVPLTPTAVSGEWQLTVRSKTTKFLVGTARSFRFTAIRSADGATAAAAVARDVVAT